MKIGIDMDDTLVNTKEMQIEYWKEYYLNNICERYTEELPDNINYFGDSYIDKFWDLYRFKLMFPSIKVDVDRITNQLFNEGHRLYIVTSRSKFKYDDLEDQMISWCGLNNIKMSGIYTDVRDKAIFMKKNNFDLLIDDDIRHVEATISLGYKAILFNDIKYFNGYQTTNWKEVPGIIKRLSK